MYITSDGPSRFWPARQAFISSIQDIQRPSRRHLTTGSIEEGAKAIQGALLEFLNHFSVDARREDEITAAPLLQSSKSAPSKKTEKLCVLNDPLCPLFSFFLSGGGGPFDVHIYRHRASLVSFCCSIFVKWSSGIKVDSRSVSNVHVF